VALDFGHLIWTKAGREYGYPCRNGDVCRYPVSSGPYSRPLRSRETSLEDALTNLRVLEREDEGAKTDERRIAEIALEKLRIIESKLKSWATREGGNFGD
jgi:hypothetical protein